MRAAILSRVALNPQQREAVEHFEGPILVLAGAGSGKTRVLTTRVCHLIQEHGVPPDRIMAVTFTNKAAGEMRERVAHMLDGEPRGIWLGTFHALGARLLRRHAPDLGWSRGFSIRDAEQTVRAVRAAVNEARIDATRWAKTIRNEISDAKNTLTGAEKFAAAHGESADPTKRRVAKVYPVYQKRLREQDAMDFDDLLMLPVRLLEENADLLAHYQDRFAFILVDEYQDTNHAQFRLLELLARTHRNLMVVGDDDQSIYGWRGADISNILDFETSFPGARVVRLEQNYRSTQVILDAANAVIRLNEHRKKKTLRTELAGGAPVTSLEAADEGDEARWIVKEIERRMLAEPELDHRDFAVLYRTNAQSRALEDRLRWRGVPYQIVGGVRFYDRREVQDVLAYLRLIANPFDSDAFVRAVGYPRRGVGKVTLERLAVFARQEAIGLLDAAAQPRRVPGLTAAPRRALAEFAALIARHAAAARTQPAGEVVGGLVEELDIRRLLREEHEEERAENVDELVSAAMSFDAAQLPGMEDEDREGFTDLALFLQQVALVADIDRLDGNADAVTLMTIHSAKGLEYEVVFVAGLEEGLFPLSHALEADLLLEEERRLFYVAITRARRKLYLTRAHSRRRAGETMHGSASSFMAPILARLEAKKTERVRAGERLMRRAARGSRYGDYRGAGPSGGASRHGGGSHHDDGFNQDRPRFVKGERVTHPTFGSGKIAELSGFGADIMVTVDFDEAGRKKLMAKYASLERDYF